jgi:hypothetical protein
MKRSRQRACQTQTHISQLPPLLRHIKSHNDLVLLSPSTVGFYEILRLLTILADVNDADREPLLPQQ